MYRVDILIVRYVRKELTTNNIEIAASVRRWRLEHRSHRNYFTALRDINDYSKLSYLHGGRNSHSVTRKEVVLDLKTVISSYAVATGPDFDVKNGNQRYSIQSRVFRNSIQADIILAADGIELFAFNGYPLLAYFYVQEDNIALYILYP